MESVKVVIFDVDGTLSLMRSGWEDVMSALFCELLSPLVPDCRKTVGEYIDASAGELTIRQMRWLAAQVESAGGKALDGWEYKRMYAERLRGGVEARRGAARQDPKMRDKLLVPGAREFLETLTRRGVTLYAASGTDKSEILLDLDVLNLTGFFAGVDGAIDGDEQCPKEAALERLTARSGAETEKIAICGDGKLEIALGSRMGIRTIGIIGSERNPGTDDQNKTERLRKAGARLLATDFTRPGPLLALLGLED